MRLGQYSVRFAGTLAVALALSACNPGAQRAEDAAAETAYAEALPMSAAPDGTPLALAPGLSALPAAAPLGYAYADSPSGDDYAWIDRADMLLDTIGDAPPDYAFGYDDVEPWAWQTQDDYLTFAEPIDGGYRYYYYEPGAAAPFLVRSPDYSYGYRDGRVAAVYGADGRILSRAAALRQAQAASRYYARARTLHAARDRNRRAVAAPRWAVRRPAVVAARRDWAQARQRQAFWRAYRERQDAVALRERRGAERQARAAAAQRFDLWQRADFRGSPPRLYDRTAPRRAAQAQRQQAQAQRQQVQTQRQQQAQARRQAQTQRQQAQTQRQQAQTRRAARQQQAEARRQAARAPTRQRIAPPQAQRRQPAQARQAARQQPRAQAQPRQAAESRRRAAQAPARQRTAPAQAQRRREQPQPRR